jgi:hypothetical protein
VLAAIQTFLIIFGLLLAGAVLAVGFLHWRGIVSFGRRKRSWGLATMGIGFVQVLAWFFLPGQPDFWLRPIIALVAAMALGILMARRAAPAR